MSSGGTAAVRPLRGMRAPEWRWSVPAWGAVAVTAAFVAVTCWWLTQDRAVPFGGESQHLYGSLLYYEAFRAGHPLRALEGHTYYPPGIRLFGVLALWLGGMSVAAPVLAQNLVFVPLLALACYRTGRLLAGPRAGLLAVVFALGSPLVIEQFHNFMLDAPETALVAVSVWLVLESDRFRRADVAALAGLAVGLGLLTKQLMPLYLLGLLPAVGLRGGGWRNWRGLAAFGGIALLVAGPWYLHHVSDWHTWVGAAGTGSATEPVPLAAAPPLLSLANLGWYLWATLNALLFAALFAIAAVGVAIAAARVARERSARTRERTGHEGDAPTAHPHPRFPGDPAHPRPAADPAVESGRPRSVADPAVELLCGLGGAWLAITVLRHHDARYAMPLIVYLAVLGTAWIVRLRPVRQTIATAALVLAVVAANLGATFGVGRAPDQRPLSNGATHEGEGVPPRDRVIVYSSLDYLISGPERSGDLLGVFRALRGAGVESVVWQDRADINDHLFESIGLLIFARMSGLAVAGVDPPRAGRPEATLIRAHALGRAPPCTRMANGTGVWIRLGNPPPRGGRDYCPGRRPAAYGP